MAVACLVGHQEENNKRLQLDEKLVGKMLDVLDAACQVRGGEAGHLVMSTVILMTMTNAS